MEHVYYCINLTVDFRCLLIYNLGPQAYLVFIVRVHKIVRLCREPSIGGPRVLHRTCKMLFDIVLGRKYETVANASYLDHGQ